MPAAAIAMMMQTMAEVGKGWGELCKSEGSSSSSGNNSNNNNDDNNDEDDDNNDSRGGSSDEDKGRGKDNNSGGGHGSKDKGSVKDKSGDDNSGKDESSGAVGHYLLQHLPVSTDPQWHWKTSFFGLNVYSYLL